MKQPPDVLEVRFTTLSTTPDGYDFFVAIHDFIQVAQSHPSFKDLTLPAKYSHFKQIHQGIEDLSVGADRTGDLGHDRYMVIQDLLKIQKNEMTESNPLWKKRDMLRRFSADIYKMLSSPSETS